MLMLLHEGHQGMCRMKALARMYVWWPGINVDIVELVGGRCGCQQNQSTPPAAPLNPWSWPTRPWAQLHLDLAGPFLGWMFLILRDAQSKWIEVYDTSSTTSAADISEIGSPHREKPILSIQKAYKVHSTSLPSHKKGE